MTDFDDLITRFRADVPGPADGAAERITERARIAAAAPPAFAPPPRPPRRQRSWTRWLALPAAATAVALVAVALWPVLDGDEGPARPGPSLLARAEAAITPANKILAANIEYTMGGKDFASAKGTMREWSLAGAGQAMAVRILITEDALDEPPSDEDTTTVTDRGGKLVDARSWSGELLEVDIPFDEAGGGSPSFVRMAVDTYRRGDLKPAGKTADGGLRLSEQVDGPDMCVTETLILDPDSLMLRQMENTTYDGKGCSGEPTQRETYTVTDARWLPATPENRRLLQIGDWPTKEIFRTVGEDQRAKRIDQAPPVPALDEG